LQREPAAVTSLARRDARSRLAPRPFLWQKEHQHSAMMLSSPVWIVALVLAAGAPWFVRAFADRLELRVRKRTEALIARAQARKRANVTVASVANVNGAAAREAPAREEQAAGEG
jgi:hypothetical protein